jgi:ubiquinone/menaquinone biosynthesis C-methylase UbiE
MTNEYWWDIANATQKGRYLVSTEKRLIAPFISDGDCVLDVGCGSGKFFNFLREKDAKYVGLETDMLPLRKFKTKFPDALLVCADGQQLPFKAGTFDGVLEVEVVGYAKAKPLFTEAARVIKKKGVLLVVTSNKHSYKQLLTEKGVFDFYTNSCGDLISMLKKWFVVVRSLGLNWIPFGRASNSRFIPLSAKLERLFGLDKLNTLSPWVFIAARKVK